MTDVFLYPGEAGPKDVALRDPTVAGGGGAPIVEISAALTGSGTLTAQALLLVLASASQNGSGSLGGAALVQILAGGSLVASGSLVGASLVQVLVGGSFAAVGSLTGSAVIVGQSTGTSGRMMMGMI